MKNIFVIILAMFLSSSLYAQVHFNVNLGSQRSWGHSGYNSHRVIIYHRQPVPYNVIYRNRYYGNNDARYYVNETHSGYESYSLQKQDNGNHKGWYKGNNGNGNSNDNGRGNDNGYYNNNGNGNYKGNDNGNGIYNGNSNENGKDLVPDKYKINENGSGNYNGNSNEKGNDVVPDKYK
jgi:hypothetical protein